ncbi:MAG: DEAD/DEAH box helicase, partial [Planctomycetes bacterium]|nr:DEAD/DEAH box helicase [Planctomycetota bacterium]
SEVDWRHVILNEAQAIKNPNTKQTRRVKEFNSESRLTLTGTPVENRLSDLWSIFDFLNPGLLGGAKTFSRFVNRLEARETDKYAPLRTLTRPYILRRLKSDPSIAATLPEKTEVKAFCGLVKKQAALYEQSVRELGSLLHSPEAEGIKRQGLVLAFLMRFKQICNHPDQWLGQSGYAPEDSGKFARLREIAEEIASRRERCLVFTQFREMTAPLAGFLAGVFGRTGLVLHGETPVKDRKKLVDAFQADNGPPFFVLSLKAGGAGLNLTAASHVVHFDRWWNPAVENQATDRAYRIGQKKNVLVHKFLVRGTIEERIDVLIESKKEIAAGVLEGGTVKALTDMSNDELLSFVRLDVKSAEMDTVFKS